MSKDRPLITPAHVRAAHRTLKRVLERAIASKGKYGFASDHEILGVLEEEFEEYKREVFKRKEHRSYLHMIAELCDVMVVGIWGVATIMARKGFKPRRQP